MRNTIRGISIVLALCIILAVPVCVSASDNQRASLFFMAHRVFIYKTGDYSYAACFDVTGTGTMQEIGAKSLSVQRSTDGENWTTVRTYTSDTYPEMIAENTITHQGEFYRLAAPGYYFRLEVELWAKDSRGTGELTVYSAQVWFD